MTAKILIVEDQFIEANNLRLILKKAGYLLCPIASPVPVALTIIGKKTPDRILIDISLQGSLPGIDLVATLKERNIAFVYLSEDSNKDLPGKINPSREKGRLKTMQENERDHILEVLESCDWKIFGHGGAAEILDMHVSTLNSRVKKLGIKKKKK